MKFKILYTLYLLLLLEVALQVALRIRGGAWLFLSRAPVSMDDFKFHPYLIGVSKKKGEERGSLEAWMRSRKGEQASPGKTRIAALGGSSTYGIGVGEKEAWPARVGRKLGDSTEVINLGVPGYTTVEALIQSALWLSEIHPAIALYYEGLNDVRNMHIKDLRGDYSDHHAKQQYGNLNIAMKRSLTYRSATMHYLASFVLYWLDTDLRYSSVVGPDPDQFTDKPDLRMAGLYERNLRNIIALCRAQGVRPVFIPQLLDRGRMRDRVKNYWFPYLYFSDVPKETDRLNAIMERVSREEHVDYIGEALKIEMGASDFLDYVHLSDSGNEKFSAVVVAALRPLLPGSRTAITP